MNLAAAKARTRESVWLPIAVLTLGLALTAVVGWSAVIGSLVSILFAVIAWSLASTRDQALRLAEFQESEGRFRALIEDLDVGVAVQGPEEQNLMVNRAALMILGVDAQQVAGMNLLHPSWQWVREDGTPLPPELNPAAVARRTMQPVHNVVMGTRHRQSGARIWLRATAVPRLTAEGALRYLLIALVDITEIQATQQRRQQAEAAIVESELRYRSIIDMAADGMITVDDSGSLLSFNRAASRIFGYEASEVIGARLQTLFAADHLAVQAATFREQLTTSWPAVLGSGLQLSGRSKTGLEIPIFLRMSEVSLGKNEIFMGVIRDLTDTVKSQAEKLQLEEQLYQVQKMEALGMLAGGIAHDFNNLLTAILGFSELASAWTTGEPRVQRALDKITLAGTRARDLVRQILSFSRRTQEPQGYFNLIDIITEVQKLIRASMPKSIELVFTSASNVATVFGNASQMHQVVVNLCTNAFQSMALGGRLTLHLDTITWTEEQRVLTIALLPGRYHRLVVRDCGAGIAPEIINRIFEPFFTTKGVGGTGLGLAVVHGLVAKHGGAIGVKSTVGVGTEFQVYWPAAVSTEPDGPDGRVTPRLRAEGIVLVLDDQPAVLAVVAAMLSELGFVVHSFGDPQQALAAFRAAPYQYLWALTDLRMPNLDGIAVCQELRAVRPELPVGILSAAIDERAQQRICSANISFTLTKPVSLSELYKKLAGLQLLRRATAAKSGG